jgi:phosphoadenosine phosphosulfate reductase
MKEETVKKVQSMVAGKNPEEALRLLSTEFAASGLIFSTSFGIEDQAIAHIIFSNHLPINVFTLDTGRLFPETYSTWNRTKEVYHQPITGFAPLHEPLQKMISEKGPNSFYESVENRKQCCDIRKVEPLKRALKGNGIWITGIRKEQSANRTNLTSAEWDAANQLIKYHPLFDWSFEEVKKYISQHTIPYNPLHDKGFPSIGCQPCTRAVKSGDDPRSGRWWWEDTTKKECGLHA